MTLPSDQCATRGTPQRTGNATLPSSSLMGRASPLSREHLQPNKLPTSTSQRLPTPTPQSVECAEDDHYQSENGVKGSQPTIRAGVRTEDKLGQHRGPSRTRHQSLSKSVLHHIAQARTPSPAAQTGPKYATSPICLLHAHDAHSAQQSSRMNVAPSAGSRPHVGCRFSYEDYKHSQVVEWLERETS
jgi:hypothetical protein